MSRDRIDERTATLNKLNDRLFKFIFASEHHKDILIRFLNSVLGEDRQIEDLDYMDREFDSFLEDGKLSHFDVRARGRDSSREPTRLPVPPQEWRPPDMLAPSSAPE